MRTPVTNRTTLRSALAVLALVAGSAGCAPRVSTPPAEPVEPVESSALDEAEPVSRADLQMVSLGYGTSSRRDVTSAISSVSSCDIGNARATRVEDLLQGRVPGVEVSRNRSGGTSVRVRGAASFVGDAEPLYVIDGMPLYSNGGGGLVGITPQDVQRIDVLKDAASTAIYGARGMNGVIVITTKRGRGGENAQGQCE